MVIGVSAILIPVAIQKSVFRKEIPIMLGVSFLLVLLSIDGELSQYDGALLLVGLGVFAFFTFRDALKQRTTTKDNSENTQNNIYVKSFGLIGIGIVVLYICLLYTSPSPRD